MARRRTNRREYPRTARLRELLREIIAEELERLDDPRLGLVTVTGVTVDSDLQVAQVRFSHLLDDATDDEVQEVLADLRPALKRAIARQARVRRTPELVFVPDEGLRAATRVDDILRDLGEDHER